MLLGHGASVRRSWLWAAAAWLTACGSETSVDAGLEDAAHAADASDSGGWPDADSILDAASAGDAEFAADAEPTLDAGLSESDASGVELPGPVDRSRSLVWTTPLILDDPRAVSFARLMALLSDDGHGGRLFAGFLRRFGTTAHSERAAMAFLADDLALAMGPDPSQWDLEQVPFTATGVHNRFDLLHGEHCGELRVSFASTHPVVQPFHLIFLLRMRPEPEESDCLGLALRFARLSALDEVEFLAAAKALLDGLLVPERALMIETLELSVSPWEWRQWVKVPNTGGDPALPSVLDNPPLFQTADTERLNRAGPERAAFLSWVASNAAAIDARRIELPEAFRSRSARVVAGVPRPPLSLEGLDPAVSARFPHLRHNLELVGCPACHTADAEFVQTRPDRTFSPFYDKELDARAGFLEAWISGERSAPPFGPLQSNPVLPN